MSYGRITLWLTLLAANVGAMQSTTASDVVVSDLYAVPGFGEIRLLGVCNVQETSLACWDDEGKLDPDVTKTVSDLIKSVTPAHGGSGPEFSFRFRRKNRLVFFRFPVAAYNTLQSVSLEQIRAPDCGNIQPIWSSDRGDKTNQTDYLPVDTDKKTSKTSIFATLAFTTGHPVALPVRVGASGSSDAGSVSIGSISRSTSGVMLPFGSDPAFAWTVLLKVPGDSLTAKLRLTVEALDEKGRTIEWVTPDGKPALAPTTFGPIRSPADAAKRPRLVPGFNSTGYMPDLGGRQWSLFVDPKYVSTLRITFKTPKIVEFKDVPLDPKN